MYSLENIYDELNEIPLEARKMAKQIAKSFSEKGFTPYAAKRVLRACEIFLEVETIIHIQNED